MDISSYIRVALFCLDIRHALVKSDIPLDLIHALERLRVVPCCVLDFGLVGRDGVVACFSLVGTVRFCACRAEVRLLDGGWWELFAGNLLVSVDEAERKTSGEKEEGDRHRCFRQRLRTSLFRRLGRRLRLLLREAW